MKKMKILQITNFFKPSWDTGGVARSAYEISRELVDRGHEVTVYTTDGKNRIDVRNATVQNVDGIQTLYFKNVSSALARANMPIPISIGSIARRDICDFDIIHIHDFRTILSVVVRHYANKYHIPYVVQPRGSAPRLTKNIPKKVFDTYFGDKIIYGAERIIASSTVESGQYHSTFPYLNSKKIIHMPNGVELDATSGLPEKGSFRRNHNIDQDTKLILYVGRIHQRKGLDVLVKAFSRLKQINVKLIIVGPDDGYLIELRKLIDEHGMGKRIILTGPLFGMDKYQAYVDSDLFVLPSKDTYESFGNVVIEALWFGTPVIVTANCGVSEWLNEKVGYVVGYNDRELLGAMEHGLKNEYLNTSCQVEGKRLISTVFNWKSVVNQLENIYSEAIIEYV